MQQKEYIEQGMSNVEEASKRRHSVAPAVRPGFRARTQMSTEGAAHIRIQSNIGIRD